MGNDMVSNSRGAVAILAGMTLVLLLGLASLVIDIGYGLVTRNALQNIADAASLAGTRVLGRIYIALTPAEQITYQLSDPDRAAIVDKVVSVAQSNYAAGKLVVIDAADVAIGQWVPQTRSLSENVDPPNAVRVIARRDGLLNGPISTFFAGILGQHTMEISALATAALTGLGGPAPGTLEVPVGIAEAKFQCDVSDPDCFCGVDIQFYPTGTEIGCGGWTTFYEESNANTLNGILDGILDGTFTAPEVQVGGTDLQFTAGNVAGALPELKAIYDMKKDASGVWETTVVVYAADDCSNPSGPLAIVGFTKVDITTVLPAPDGQLIQGVITCETFEDGQSGGGSFGVIGSIPKLVQ